LRKNPTALLWLGKNYVANSSAISR